jgi:hypothetical protein
MVNVLRKTIGLTILKIIDRLPSWTIDKENKKNAKRNIVGITYSATSSYHSNVVGDYLLFPDFIELETEITILNPSPIFRKTLSLRYNCVILTVKDKLVNVYCPV